MSKRCPGRVGSPSGNDGRCLVKSNTSMVEEGGFFSGGIGPVIFTRLLGWSGGEGQSGGRQRMGPSTKWVELYRPAQLLMGLCLEVALKGLLVKRDPTLVSGGRIKELKTHSLQKLFQLAEIPLEDGEEELNLVRKLSDAVEWVAKYPVPANASQLRQPKHKSQSTLIRNDRDFDRFEALWRRVNREFGDE